jgi:hypothetical protein
MEREMDNASRESRQYSYWCAARKAIVVALIAGFSLEVQAALSNQESTTSSPDRGARGRAAAPALFEQNRGQHPDAVVFSARMRTYDAFFLREGINLRSRDGAECTITFPPSSRPEPSGLRHRPATVNYYRGADRSEWVENIELHDAVIYRDFAPGADLAFTTRGETIEYEWLFPSGEPVHWREPEWISACEGGMPGEMLESGPAVRLLSRSSVSGRSDGTEAASAIQHNEVSMRPASLAHSTLLGGTDGHDWAESVFVTADGDVFVAGSANSRNLRTTPGALQRQLAGGGELFVARFDSGGELVFLTYLGGTDNETFRVQIAVDDDSVYLVAGSRSTNFPTTANAYQQRHAGGLFDGVFVRLSLDGGTLLYSTFIGGSGDDRAWAMALSGSQVVIGGRTDSLDFPIVGSPARGDRSGGIDAFVAIYENDRLTASSYLGGGGEDSARSVAVDRDGLIFVGGTTASVDFPTTEGARQRSYGGGDMDSFVTVFSHDLSRIVASTYLGGSNLDVLRNMEAHPVSGVVVVGFTLSNDFPTTPSSLHPASRGGEDGFAAHIRPDAGMEWSTYIGGTGDDEAADVAFNRLGEIWIAGATRSSDFPITDRRHQAQLAGQYDSYLLRLTPDGETITYSAVLGGTFNDAFSFVVTGPEGTIWAVGGSYSRNFPTSPDAHQRDHNGLGLTDAIVVKFIEELPPPAEMAVWFRWTPGAPHVG